MKKNKEKEIQDINPYEVDKLSRIPSWLVILILKYWAAAAAVYFTLIGGLSIGLDFTNWDIATTTADQLAQDEYVIYILTLGMAVILNYIVKPIVRLMYNRRNNTYKYNMVNGKGFLFLFVTIAYTFFLSVVLYFITIFLSEHHLVLDLFGTADNQGIDPFTYALCFILVDFICLFIKNSIVSIYKRIKYNRQFKNLEA